MELVPRSREREIDKYAGSGELPVHKRLREARRDRDFEGIDPP